MSSDNNNHEYYAQYFDSFDILDKKGQGNDQQPSYFDVYNAINNQI